MSDASLLKTSNTELSSTELPWRRWLLAFDLHNATSSILFTSAIWVIYLAAHGYDPLAIGLFEMLFHISKFLAEIPTGIFADLVGRRKSLIIFCVIDSLHCFLFLVPTLPMLLLNFILSGVSYAFRGGASEALLWNLAQYPEVEQQNARYSKLVSRMVMIMVVGEVIGTASGGYMSNLLQVLPFIARAIVAALSIIPLLMIPEPPRESSQTGQKVHPLLHLGKGIKAVWQSHTLLGLLLISGLTESCWTTIYFYYQLYLRGFGFSLDVIGLIVAVGSLANFAFTALAPRVMRLLSERRLLILFLGMQVAGLFLMTLPQPIVGLIGYLVLFQAAIAILYPALSTYINQRSPEEQRATILSLQTGLFSAAMIVLFPLFGLGLSHTSYTTVYQWTLLAFSVSLVGIWGLMLLIKFKRRG